MEERIKKITDIFKRTSPDARIVLNYGNNWELLAAVILSAQCTDKKVNEVTSVLFSKYKRTMSNEQKTMNEEEREIENFATVVIGELEQDIKSTGFYRNKAKNIRGAAKMILEEFGGKLPRTMAEMLTIPGVARKTANVVLGNAYGVVEGIAVDTHVLRLSQRLRLVPLDKIGPGKKPIWFTKYSDPQQYASHSRGLRPLRQSSRFDESKTRRVMKSRLRGTGVPTDFSQKKNQGPSVDYYKDALPEKIEQELMKIVSKKDWFILTYWLIDHGRAICKAQRPDCAHCLLNKLCPSSRV